MFVPVHTATSSGNRWFVAREPVTVPRNESIAQIERLSNSGKTTRPDRPILAKHNRGDQREGLSTTCAPPVVGNGPRHLSTIDLLKPIGRIVLYELAWFGKDAIVFVQLMDVAYLSRAEATRAIEDQCHPRRWRLYIHVVPSIGAYRSA